MIHYKAPTSLRERGYVGLPFCISYLYLYCFPFTWMCFVESLFQKSSRFPDYAPSNELKIMFSIRVLLVIIDASKWGGAGSCVALAGLGKIDVIIIIKQSSFLKFIFLYIWNLFWCVVQNGNPNLKLIFLTSNGLCPLLFEILLLSYIDLYIYIYTYIYTGLFWTFNSLILLCWSVPLVLCCFSYCFHYYSFKAYFNNIQW